MERKGDFVVGTAIFRVDITKEASAKEAERLQTIDPVSDELNEYWFEFFSIENEDRHKFQYCHDVCALHFDTIKTVYPAGFGYIKVIDDRGGNMIIRGHVLDIVGHCDPRNTGDGWIDGSGA